MTDSLWLERSHRRIICEYSILMYAGRWCYPSTTSLRVLCDFSLEINLFGHQDSLQDWFRIWAACGGALQTSGARSVDCWFRHGVLKQEISNEKRAWLESCWDCQRQRSLNRAGNVPAKRYLAKVPKQLTFGAGAAPWALPIMSSSSEVKRLNCSDRSMVIVLVGIVRGTERVFAMGLLSFLTQSRLLPARGKGWVRWEKLSFVYSRLQS